MIDKKFGKRISSILVTIFVITSILSPLYLSGLASTPPKSPTTIYTSFLPLVIRANRLPNIMGIETSYVDQNLLSKASGINAYWWRYSAFSWKGIEPNDVNPAQYNWGAVNEHHLIDANNHGFSIVAVVKYTPYFSQKIDSIYSIPCSPIKDDPSTIAEFQEFIQALAIRYSAPPYNIRYWQFGNEPDISPNWVGSNILDTPFGCWGDDTDPLYYGGEYYGKFLKIFSDTIKSVNPSAQITNGGLLLKCHPFNDATSCPSQMGNFFEGMIKYLTENSGLDALDFASFHAYTSWYANLSFDENSTGFAPIGGILLGKAYFLREVMSNYGINPPIPLLVTEAGLMCLRSDSALPLPSGLKCSDAQPPPEYSDDQADYVVWTYVRAIADGISGVMWYMLNYQPYRHVGLLNTDGSGKPAYIAYQFMSSQIGTAQYVGKLNQYFPILRAYEFTKGSQRIWVMWAPDQADHAISIPAGFQSAYDKLGVAINLAPGATTITVNSPVYLFLN